jgi:phosphatidylserine/phosphatidylglycerophosphate/cardiolipin synthase-like enzyme
MCISASTIATPSAARITRSIVVVDDALAFCGGIDLTSHRWDTSAHRVEEPARRTGLDKPYGPYHEVQAMVMGPVAASLGALARDRWRALGEKTMPAVSASHDDLWPPDCHARSLGRGRRHRQDHAGIGDASGHS